MKTIVILQNSYISFGLDASKIFQSDKYKIYLIINEFGFNIVKSRQQNQYYEKILVTNDFSYENILSLINTCKENSTDFDIVTNSEETMPVCGQLRVKFGLDNEDYSRFYDKHVMKTKLINAQFIAIPKYKLFNPNNYHSQRETYLKSLIENMDFPLFVKPIQSYSSINAKKIHNYTELKLWAEAINTHDYYEIDEFIDGTMYHCDSYIKDHKILFTFVSQNSRPCYDFTIGNIKGTIVLPADHPNAVMLSTVTAKTLQQLGMPKSGVTHLELFKTTDNKIYFVEIAHRSPGCLIPKMYQAHADIDTISAHFLLQIDPDYYPVPTPVIFAAWTCYPKIPGDVIALKKPPNNLQSQYEVEWHVRVGDKIKTYSQFGRDYTGTLFMTHPNFPQLYAEFQIINNLNLCEIAPTKVMNDKKKLI